jgi:hypothetical protein
MRPAHGVEGAEDAEHRDRKRIERLAGGARGRVGGDDLVEGRGPAGGILGRFGPGHGAQPVGVAGDGVPRGAFGEGCDSWRDRERAAAGGGEENERGLGADAV